MIKKRLRYGTHPSQVADLFLPRAASGRLPVAVVIHGGFWRTRYGRSLGTSLARDLVRNGVAALNIEYRRVGASRRSGGGGWPDTCLDVAAGIDLLAGDQVPREQVDLDRVVAVGHSAGGQLAGWAAGRHRFPADLPGATPAVRLRGFVSQAGVLDLEHGAATNLGDGAVQAFLGGEPHDHPDRYRAASPIRWLPGVPAVCVHGTRDQVVPIEQSERFVAVAAEHGQRVELIRLDQVGHRELIVPIHRAWHAALGATLRLLRD